MPSGGEQQGVAVAVALVRPPAGLIVDELSTGFHPIAHQPMISTKQHSAVDGATVALVAEQTEPAPCGADRV